MFHSPFINPLQDLPEADPLGLEAWAASNGLAPGIALALVASVLAGVAGPSRDLGLPDSQLDNPGINLAALEENVLISMALAQLAAPFRSLQAPLIARAKEFTAAEIEDAMYLPGLGSRNADDLARLASPQAGDFDIHDVDPDSRLAKDCEFNGRTGVYDNLARPRFLLDGSLPPDLAKALLECHGGLGTACGSVVALPPGVDRRNQRISSILAAFRGTSATRPVGSTRARIREESLRITGLLRFSRPDFQWIVANRRDLFRIVLPVPSPTGTTADTEVDERHALKFLRLFRNVAPSVLAARRAHSRLAANFSSDAAVLEFLRRRRAFVRELQDVPEDCRVHGATGLPGVMAWALIRLAGNNLIDDYILHTTFDAARSLVAGAGRCFLEHDRAALAERRFEVARKLYARMAKLGPCKRRDLVRCLDQQSLGLHEPVISAMTSLGIFVEDADRVLRMGRVPIQSLTTGNLIMNGQP